MKWQTERKMEFLANNTFVALSLLIALIEAVRVYFWPKSMPPEEVDASILFVLGFLAVDRVIEAFRSAGGKTTLEQVKAHLLRLETTYKTPARVVPCPDNDPTVYAHLFGGFTGAFYAYNPHYTIESIEKGSNSLNPAQKLLITRVYIPRYCTTDHCEAHYLFSPATITEKKISRNSSR